MALSIRTMYRNSYHIFNITKQSRWYIGIKSPLRVVSSGLCYSNSNNLFPLNDLRNKKQDITLICRQLATEPGENNTKVQPNGFHENNEKKIPEPKLGLVQRFKQMYRDYWYVLLPVHMTTSVIWIGGFYYAVRSGLDVIGLLESMNISDKWLDPLRESKAGYFALALACYKLATPLRYTVTVGGTTYAINKLTAFGLIKPVPSKARLKEIIQEKKGNIHNKYYESKSHYQSQMRTKRVQVMDEMRKYKSEMRELKDKMKKF